MKGGFGRPFFLLRPPECLADTADHLRMACTWHCRD